MKRILLALFILVAAPLNAANWLMLQGSEPEGQTDRAKVWGFVQPEYAQTDDTLLSAGGWAGQKAVFNQNGPDLKSSDGFNVRRARIGVRGSGFVLDTKTNYFILAEFGNNGITNNGGGSAKITDMSVTANHFKGMRIRAGQFKFPGAEEALQAIHVTDYNNFTNFTNQMILERFFDGTGAATDSPNRPNGAIGAFRDVGIQLFETFKQDNDWEFSYAVMLGNGNGIARGDNDDNKDIYFYTAAEKVYDGKGPRREHLKIFAWNQNGKRTLINDGAGEYDRSREGVGVTYRQGKYRAAAEFMQADGMIFNGTDGGALAGSKHNANENIASWNIATTGEADGYYLHFGYALKPNIELDVRYDVLNRLTDNRTGERQFITTTLGMQYFLNKKSRLTLNYEFREAEAPNLAGNHPANQILDGIDDRLSLQLLFIF